MSASLGKEDVAGLSFARRASLGNEPDAERKTSTLRSFLDNKPAKEGGRSKLLPNFTKAALEQSLPSALADRISDASGNLNSLGNLNTLRRGMTWVGDLTPKHIRQLSGGGGGTGKDTAEAEPEYELDLHVVQDSAMTSVTLCVRWDSMVLRARKDGKAWLRNVHMLDILSVTVGPQSTWKPQQKQNAVDAGLTHEAQLITITLVHGPPLALALATLDEALLCARHIERRRRGLHVFPDAVLEGNLLERLAEGSWGVRRVVLAHDSLWCYPFNSDAGDASCVQERLQNDAKYVQVFALASISQVEAWGGGEAEEDDGGGCSCIAVTIGSEREARGHGLQTRASLWGRDSSREARVLVLDCLMPEEARRWADALQRWCGESKQVYVWGQWGGFEEEGGLDPERVMKLRMPPLAKARERERDRDAQAGTQGPGVGGGEGAHLGEVSRMPLPAEVPGLNGQRVLGVACGESHGVAVMQDGCVWSWGCGRAGQLGRGSDGPRGEPLRLAALVNGSTGVRQVACGADCSMAVTQGGALLVWGDLSWCSAAVAGRDCPEDERGADKWASGRQQGCERGRGQLVPVAWQPRVMRVAGGLGVWEVSCGLHHAALVLVNGRLMTWGMGYAGQLGLGDLLPRHLPCLVDLDSVQHQRGRVWKVACGSWHSAAISEYGHLITWGAGHDGQLGHGDKSICMLPKTVRGLVSPSPGEETGSSSDKAQGSVSTAVEEAVCHVSCAQTHSIALTVTGHALVWGKGPDGQLGLGPHATSSCIPRCVPGLSGLVCVAAGRQVSTALTRSGDLYCWGSGVCLGADLEEGRAKPRDDCPQKVKVPPSFEPQKISARLSGRVEQVACGAVWCAVVCRKDSTRDRLESAWTATDRITSTSSSASRPPLPPGLCLGEVDDGREGMAEELKALDMVLESARLLAQQGVISARDLEEQKRQVFQSKLCHWMEGKGPTAPLGASPPLALQQHTHTHTPGELRPGPSSPVPGSSQFRKTAGESSGGELAAETLRKSCGDVAECYQAGASGGLGCLRSQASDAGVLPAPDDQAGRGSRRGRSPACHIAAPGRFPSGRIDTLIQEAADEILSALAGGGGEDGEAAGGQCLEDLLDEALSVLEKRVGAEVDAQARPTPPLWLPAADDALGAK